MSAGKGDRNRSTGRKYRAGWDAVQWGSVMTGTQMAEELRAACNPLTERQRRALWRRGRKLFPKLFERMKP